MNQYWILGCLVVFIGIFFYALVGLWKSRFQLSISFVPEVAKGEVLKSSSLDRLQKELSIRWPLQKVYMDYKKGIYGCLWTYRPSQFQKESMVFIIHQESLFPVFEKLDQYFQENIPTAKKIMVLLTEGNPGQALLEFGIQKTTIVQTELEFPFTKGISYQQEGVWDVYLDRTIDLDVFQSYFVDCHLQVIEDGVRLCFPRFEVYQKGKRMLKKLVEQEGILTLTVLERNGFIEKEKGIVSLFQYSLPKQSDFIGIGYRHNGDGYAYMDLMNELLKKGSV